MAGQLNLVRFNPTLGGTTDWVFSTIVAGHATPAQAGAVNGKLYKVHSFSADGSQWELSEGAYTSASGTFARTTILYNSSATGTAPGQSGAGTKINFTTVPQCSVVLLKEDLLLIDEANSWTATQRAQARTDISAVLKGQIFGLTLSAAGATATFGVAAGEAADSTGVDLMVLASAFTKTTAAWAVGTGNGALDTGAIAASTWYHAYLIKRVDNGVVDLLISLSATAPTLPANYTLSRRIGSMKTNGSSQWIKFVQDGDWFTWDVEVLDVVASNPGTAAVLRTLSVPLGIRVLVKGVAAVDATVAGDSAVSFLLSDPSIADTAPHVNSGAISQSLYLPTATGEALLGGMFMVYCNTSSQIRSRLQASSTGTGLYIHTNAWMDPRGRNA